MFHRSVLFAFPSGAASTACFIVAGRAGDSDPDVAYTRLRSLMDIVSKSLPISYFSPFSAFFANSGTVTLFCVPERFERVDRSVRLYINISRRFVPGKCDTSTTLENIDELVNERFLTKIWTYKT